jgi:nucleotide-binding universal stress UspA family protein
MKHILVAFDGSETGGAGVRVRRVAGRQIRRRNSCRGGRAPPEPPEEVETEAAIESAREHYQQQFATLQARAAKAGVKASFVVLVGHPAEQIVHYAETHAIDHIVLGHRGKTFFRRWLLGSVSKQVIHYAHCTTTVVR